MRRTIRYFQTFDEIYGRWHTFVIFAATGPDGQQGHATIMPIGEALNQAVQENHIVSTGGANAAMARAVTHLDNLYPPPDGWNRWEDIG